MIYAIQTYSLKALSDNDWENILKYKKKILVLEDYKYDGSFLRFPGFVTSSKDVAISYVKSVYKYFKDAFTPPRGNISSSLKYIILGFAPGYSNLSRGEPNWLLGPSSRVLHSVLDALKIYPYFTNLYKNPFLYNKIVFNRKLFDEYFVKLKNELLFLKDVSNNDLEIIVLGRYTEFDMIIEQLRSDFVFHRVWHPSYICRNYKLFPEYVKMFERFVK